MFPRSIRSMFARWKSGGVASFLVCYSGKNRNRSIFELSVDRSFSSSSFSGKCKS